MAAGAISRVLRAPGRLVVGPTNLAATFPYGGTQVGLSQDVVVRPAATPPTLIEAEGLGEATDVLEPSRNVVFACILRGYDDDAVAQFFSVHYTAGGTSQHAMMDVPGTQVPGSSASARAKVLLWVPDNVLDVPAVLAYAAVPTWDDGAELAFQRGAELALPLAFQCMRDANGNILSVARFADLSLT